MSRVISSLSASGGLVSWFAEQLLARPIVLVIFGLVLLYVLYQVTRVRRETLACKAWIDSKDVPETAQTVQQIRLFLSESERWRYQGIAVPMTDYSDRIDSLIEGLADHLHNGVNLFLIVGLAGTFFGMAEFARQAPAISTTSDPKDVLEALRVALGHSFPVGFLGLCLTIIAHPIAGYYEAQLREAAKDAVNRALRLRTATLKQQGTDAVAEELRQMPEKLAVAFKSIENALLNQLQPLVTIPHAIREANEAAIGPLREMFSESRKEWNETVTKLSKHSGRTAEAIQRLETPIIALTTKIGDVTDLVKANEDAVNRINKQSEQVAALLALVQSRILSLVNSLATATQDMTKLPAAVREQLQAASDLITSSIRSYYEGLGQEYVSSMRDLAAASATEITAASGTAARSIEGAAESLRISADAVTPELRNAIQQGADHLRGHLQTFNEAFGKEFPRAVEKLEKTLTSATGLIACARDVLDSMSSSATSAAEHVKSWREVEAQLSSIESSLRADVAQLAGLGERVESSAKLHASLAPAIKETTAAFNNVTHGLREVLTIRPALLRTRPWWKVW
jgi:uncharacterized phage infection (PIP) family protein YhgE